MESEIFRIKPEMPDDIFPEDLEDRWSLILFNVDW